MRHVYIRESYKHWIERLEGSEAQEQEEQVYEQEAACH